MKKFGMTLTLVGSLILASTQTASARQVTGECTMVHGKNGKTFAYIEADLEPAGFLSGLDGFKYWVKNTRVSSRLIGHPSLKQANLEVQISYFSGSAGTVYGGLTTPPGLSWVTRNPTPGRGLQDINFTGPLGNDTLHAYFKERLSKHKTTRSCNSIID